jgi:hypothetical protein
MGTACGFHCAGAWHWYVSVNLDIRARRRWLKEHFARQVDQWCCSCGYVPWDVVVGVYVENSTMILDVEHVTGVPLV